MNAPGKSEFWTQVFLAAIGGCSGITDSFDAETIVERAQQIATEAEFTLKAAADKAIQDRSNARENARREVLAHAIPGRVYLDASRRLIVDRVDSSKIHFLNGTFVAWNELSDCCIEPTDETVSVEEERAKLHSAVASFRPGQRYRFHKDFEVRTVHGVEDLYVVFDTGTRVHVADMLDMLAGDAELVTDAAA